MNDVVTEYARRNRYRLNGDKSAVMVFNASKLVERAVAEEPWRLSGEVVEVKKVYKYLGVEVLSNTKDWKPYVNRIIAKARRVSEDLEWACRRDGGLRPRSAATLWKAIVRPVLEYAAEIWAGEIPGNLVTRAEAVQTTFARSVLGLVGCQSVSNDALRAELGLEKLTSRWEKLRLGYWRRLHVASADRTLSVVAALRRAHLNWDRKGAEDGWMGETRTLLKKLDLDRHWDDPGLCAAITKDEWKDVVYEAVESHEGDVLAQRFTMMRGEAAARYARIKKWTKVTAEFAVFSGEVGRRGGLVSEPYLDDRTESVGRRLKLMCRMGCLPTMVRVAREEKLPEAEGRCRLCTSNVPEDLRHFLLECPAHRAHRCTMLDAVVDAVKVGGGHDLQTMEAGKLVDILLGESTGAARGDARVNVCVSRFLKKAWRGRKRLTRALNDKLGREDTIWALQAHGDGECRAASLPTHSSRRHARAA